MFFERIPFRGIGILPIRHVIDHNINADRFESPSENHHRINAFCSIGLFQRAEEHPKTSVVYLRSTDSRLFSLWTFLFEDEDQWDKHKQDNPNVADPRPMRIATSRDIFEITEDSHGYSYKGVKRLKSR